MSDYATVKARKLRYVERQRLGIPTSLVPAGPVQEYLHELTDLGWSLTAVAAWVGVHDSTLACIARGDRRQVERKVARVLDVPFTLAVPAHIPGTCRVPQGGARRRVEALLRLGWRHCDIRAAAGVHTEKFRPSIWAADWRAIAAAYDTLSARPGPSWRARARAEAAGYWAPLAWEDIDDPTEVPTVLEDSGDVDEVTVTRILAGDWRLPATFAERVQVVARWTGTHNELARLTGWKVDRYAERAAA